MDTSILGKIMIILTGIPQYWGLLLDVIEKMANPNFAKELAKFARKEACWVKVTIIKIIRGFDPVKFIGKGWSIEEGETDTRSTALTELDLTKVQFVMMLKDDETYVNGEEKLKRLKESGNIRLDADIFLTLWENQHLIPESWKEKIDGNTRFIYFDGTILRNPYGNHNVLYLYWYDGAWHWCVHWLGSDWNADYPSAVLES